MKAAHRSRSKLLAPAALFAALAVIVATGFMSAPGVANAAGCGTTNVALNQPASASSYENQGAYPASAAFDGNTGTRWSSVFADPQWKGKTAGLHPALPRLPAHEDKRNSYSSRPSPVCR